MRKPALAPLAILSLCIACLPLAAMAEDPPVTSDLRLWLRADVGVFEDIAGLDSAEDGDGVAHWDDQLVAGQNTTNNYAKAANDPRQPTYHINMINGLPAIQFINDADAAQDDFMNGDGGALLTSGTNARTVFVVARHDGGSESSTALIELNGQADSSTTGAQYRVTTEAGVRVNSGSRLYSTAMSTRLFQVLTVQTPGSPSNNTSNTSAWINGTALGVSSTAAQTVNTGTAGYRLAGGTGSSPGGSLNGHVAEILVYEEALNATERAAVEEHLMTKYRLRTQVIAAPAKPIKVFLLGGQSNMAGQGAVSDVGGLRPELNSEQTDVAIWQNLNNAASTNTGWETLAPGQGASTSLIGPELSLGRALADAFPDYQIALIKYSKGGTNLDVEWDPKDTGGTAYMYDGFLESMGNALADLTADGLSYEIEGMFWMQGERDARDVGMASRYQANLADLITAIRAQTGEAHLPFILGRLADDLNTGTYTELDVVRAAQAAIGDADDWAAMVDTDAFGMKTDNLHFNAAGQLAMGDAFADAYLAIPEPSTMFLLALGGIALLRRRRATA